MQAKMGDMVSRLHSGPITDVVHLGIGGSYWGPQCVLDALADLPSLMQVHCVAELDPHALDDVLTTLHPETTVFIIASKSFTTYETMENAHRAVAWLKSGLKDNVESHLIAITEKIELAQAFGVHDDNILPMWDWVGGRYSIWSSMALPVCLRYGMQPYWDLLAGAKAMDDHFLEADWSCNMPVILALLSYWSTQFCRMPAEVILPYPYRLRSIIPHLQQLCMESLGKARTLDGREVEYLAGPMVWGCLGSQAQHTFNQWLQQSPYITPVEFILPTYDKALLAQGLAQSQALAFGDNHANVHARLSGNRPNHTLYIKALDANTMGSLLALYEHKVFCFAMMLNINPFDQFGVEHSKHIARELLKQMEN
jgi:glucose-6-phosphate isomerase